MIDSVFTQLSLIVVIAMLVSAVMRILKQPLIIGYILTGIIVSPCALDLMGVGDTISTFSHMGIAFLLFIVGLNLNPRLVKELGRVSVIVGLGQILFTSIFGFLIARFFGFSFVSSLYLAIALTFSSTIIIMKIISDKRELETLYARISIGFLLFQDLVAVLILMFLPSFSSGANISDLLFMTFFKSVGLMGVLLFMGVYVLPRVEQSIAKSQEFLFLFSLGWVFALSSLFNYLSFSIEIGAFLAGVTLSLSKYRYEIIAKVRPLRDFFIILFFVSLGAQIEFTVLTHYLPVVLAFSLFVLIGNPLIVMLMMGFVGYTKKNSFLVGITSSQISEFSFILIALAVSIGHVPSHILSIVTLIGLLTIAGSTYFMLSSNAIYKYFSPYLRIFERKGKKLDEYKYHKDEAYDILLFGYNRIGFDVLRSFQKLKKKFLVIDYNPEVVVKLAKEGFDCRYGDVTDSDMLNDLDLSKVKMAVSTIPNLDISLFLLNELNKRAKKSVTIMVSHEIDEAIELYNKGATYVILPHFLGGHRAATMIEEYGFNFRKFLKEGAAHMKDLRERKMRGHEHPTHEK